MPREFVGHALLLGIGAFLLGLIWLIGSLADPTVDGILGGGWWKGPLLSLLGVAVLIHWWNSTPE